MEKYIEAFVKDSLVTAENTIPLVRYLFHLYTHGEIGTSDLQKLQNMKVLTRSRKLSPVNELYLYSAYDPIHGLENILRDAPDQFITSTYIEDDKTPIFRWKDFFVALGAKLSCELEVLDEVRVSELKKRDLSFLKEYLRYLHSYPNALIGRAAFDTDIYRSFISFPKLERLAEKSFAGHFWRSLIPWGKQLIDVDRACQFLSETKKSAILYPNKMSYLRFVLNTYPCIRGTDGQLHPASELYSPAFNSVSGHELIVAEIDVGLNEELLDYLGFKTRLTAEQCHDFLMKMRQKGSFEIQFYLLLLKNFLRSWNPATQQDLLKKEWFFWAENNTWQPVKGLKCYGLLGANPFVQSGNWFKNVLAPEDMKYLAQIFSCPIITESAAIGQIAGAKPSADFRDLLLEKLPFLAWIRAHNLCQNPLDVLRSLATCLKGLAIQEADHIPAIEGEDRSRSLDVVLIHNHLYHLGHWKNNKPKLLNRLGEYLGLDKQAIEDFTEILSLKESGQSLRKRKSEKDWMAEKGMKASDLEALRKVLEEYDLSEMPALLLPSQTSPEKIEPKSPQLDLKEAKEHLSIPSSPEPSPEDLIKRMSSLNLDDKPEALKKPSEISKWLFSPAKETDSPSITARHQEWAPEFEVEKLPVSEKSIKKAEIPLPSSSPSLKSDKPKMGFKKNLSDIAKGLIGYWGEEFAVKCLLDHYIRKYQCTMAEFPPGNYMLRGNQIAITVLWFNKSRESGKPYDLAVTKIKSGQEPKNKFMEIKASKGGKVRFFLSQNEWDFMKQEANCYRLYFVLHAGKASAEIKKIAKLSEWIAQGLVSVTEKITYEVRI